MPMYEYQCAACGHRFERIRKFSDPPIDECPNCGERKVQKLLSSPAIQFKGTGWYITDYARAGKSDPNQKADKKAAKQEAKAESGSSSESSSSSESKTSSESSKTTTADASKK
jgi:putative FmdB family regulatory protein